MLISLKSPATVGGFDLSLNLYIFCKSQYKKKTFTCLVLRKSVVTFIWSTISFITLWTTRALWRAGIVQQCEQLPPINVAQVSVPYASWVCCWFSPCSKGSSSGSPVFLLSTKSNISKFQFDQNIGPARKPEKASFLNIVNYLFLKGKWKIKRKERNRRKLWGVYVPIIF